MKRLNLGLVGLNFGKILVEREILSTEGAGHPFFRIAAVCSTSVDDTDAVAKVWSVNPYYTLDSLLNKSEIDAVCLMTEPAGRAELIRQIIRAGKDVITTKPFETNADEAQSVLEEAIRLGRTIHMNSPTPWPSADLMKIMQWRKQYNLGRPIAAHWQTWCKYNEVSDGKWYDDGKLCPVAPVYRLGIYCLNDLLWFFENPREVQVMQSRIATGRPTPDNGLLTIKYRDNSLVSIFASFCIFGGYPYPDILTLNFENGTIYRNAGIAENRPPQGAQLELVTGSPDNPITETAIFKEYEKSGSYMWKRFYEAVNCQKIRNEISPKQVADSIRIIDAMRRASFSQRTEKVIDASA